MSHLRRFHHRSRKLRSINHPVIQVSSSPWSTWVRVSKTFFDQYSLFLSSGYPPPSGPPPQNAGFHSGYSPSYAPSYGPPPGGCVAEYLVFIDLTAQSFSSATRHLPVRHLPVPLLRNRGKHLRHTLRLTLSRTNRRYGFPTPPAGFNSPGYNPPQGPPPSGYAFYTLVEVTLMS